MLLLTLIACGPNAIPDQVWEAGDIGYTTGLSWGDFDGDGVHELITAAGNDIEAGPVRVLDADGSIIEVGPVHFHGHVSVGDVDGDGFDDAAVARYIGDDGEGVGGVDLYVGSDGGLVLTPAWQWDGANVFSAVLGDADGDGDLDLAVATGLPDGDATPDHVFLGDGTTLSAEPDWSTEPSLSFDAAFVDGDLVFARHESPHARYAGLTEPPVWLARGSGFAGNTIATGDVDGDGIVDMVVSDNIHYPGAGEVRLYCGADWELCWSEGEGRGWSAVDLLDFDDDGDLDLFTGEWWGPVRLFENEDGLPGDEVWTSERAFVAEAFAWREGQLVVSDWEPERGSTLFAW